MTSLIDIIETTTTQVSTAILDICFSLFGIGAEVFRPSKTSYSSVYQVEGSNPDYSRLEKIGDTQVLVLDEGYRFEPISNFEPQLFESDFRVIVKDNDMVQPQDILRIRKHNEKPINIRLVEKTSIGLREDILYIWKAVQLEE